MSGSEAEKFTCECGLVVESHTATVVSSSKMVLAMLLLPSVEDPNALSPKELAEIGSCCSMGSPPKAGSR